MFAEYHHADLFWDRDERALVARSFFRLAADKFSGACEASAISRQSNQAWMRGNILNQMAMPTSSILREAARAFNSSRLSRSASCAQVDRVARGGGNCAAEKSPRKLTRHVPGSAVFASPAGSAAACRVAHRTDADI